MVSFAVISDTHQLPLHAVLDGTKADVLIHCGDALYSGMQAEFENFCRELYQVRKKFTYVLYVPGNHDIWVERNQDEARKMLQKIDVTMLIDQPCQIGNIKIYGSPYVPTFGSWAFMLNRGEQINEKWKKIPDDTDILITHGPPHGILDWAIYSRAKVGCEDLLIRVKQVKPKFHLYGHIHHDGGQSYSKDGTTFINAAVATEKYEFGNPPMMFDCE